MDKKRSAELSEVYEDLRDFKEIKQSISELLKMRRTATDDNDPEKIKEIKLKAMDAIDHLFADETIGRK